MRPLSKLRLRSPLTSSRRRRGGRGWLFETRRDRRPRARLRLRRLRGNRLHFDLRVTNARLPVPPRSCAGARPGIDLARRPIELRTRLRIDDGRRRPVAIALRPRWSCRRDRVGAVRRLAVRQPQLRRPSQRRLVVAIRAPRAARPGSAVTYRIGVRNPRRRTAYDVMIRSPLARQLRLARRVRGARVGGRQVVWRLRSLRPHRTKVLRLRVRIARGRRRESCQAVFVEAIDTRPSRARACIRIRSARPARLRPASEPVARLRGP